ncbi:hypothetical protein [Bradyrhizobium manausense]|uniref:Oxidoreductase n=1 Tax=Bradyrhizobium manausense TaxID=989370 RepID=A0A0R3E0G3_9BRAD|nr:hypothetical protein [Bradyrhizobium manausense]KRQ15706.1 hypothetical protein AOQ71_08395 [Bradyrhizobium manausense]
MAQTSASASIKMLVVVIIGLAAMPAVSFAQTTGGATGSTGGVANAPAPPGTNSLGTAQSSGANTAPGVTTGAASGTNPDADATVSAENRLLDKKMKSICRGC